MTHGPPHEAALAAPWLVSATNALPTPEGIPPVLWTVTWLEKPVIAPQFRSNGVASKSPLGARAVETVLFWQVSKQALTEVAKTANATLLRMLKW
jgi:hypothetical protein